MTNVSTFKYLFLPEDSTHGVTESLGAALSWPVRTAKTLLWMGVAVLMSVGISQLY